MRSELLAHLLLTKAAPAGANGSEAAALRYASATRAGELLGRRPHSKSSTSSSTSSSSSGNSSSPSALNLAGMAFVARGDFPSAQACFQGALRGCATEASASASASASSSSSSSLGPSERERLEPAYNLAALYWATGALRNARELLLYIFERMQQAVEEEEEEEKKARASPSTTTTMTTTTTTTHDNHHCKHQVLCRRTALPRAHGGAHRHPRRCRRRR